MLTTFMQTLKLPGRANAKRRDVNFKNIFRAIILNLNLHNNKNKSGECLNPVAGLK